MNPFISLLTLTTIALTTSLNIQAKPLVKPNIVFILADDMGMGIMGKHGQQIIKTPHIDALAKQGMTFTRVYSSKYCCPSRASLLQGIHNKHTHSYTQTAGGLCMQRDREGWSTEELQTKASDRIGIKPSETEVFLPEVLKKAGYATGQYGKLEWGFMTCHSELSRHGWTDYCGYYDHERAHGYYPKYLWKNGKELILPGNTLNNAGKTAENYGPGSTEKRRDRTGKQTFAPDVMLKEALSFMETHKKEPFFLYFSTNLPHGPVDIPTKDNVYRNNNQIKTLYKNATGNNVECYSAAQDYASMVKKLDDQIGIIIKKVIELNKMGRPTVVFISSDNGHELYYRTDKNKGRQSNYHGGIVDDSHEVVDIFQGSRAVLPTKGNKTQTIDFCGLKWTVYEGGTRTPLIVWSPSKGLIKPGSVNHRLTAIYDHMATFADLAGAKMPEGKDSISYKDSLFKAGQVSAKETHPYVIADESLITNDGWKFIAEKGGQLYNLNKDPEERNNLATTETQKLEELRSLFKKEAGSPRKDR